MPAVGWSGQRKEPKESGLLYTRLNRKRQHVYRRDARKYIRRQASQGVFLGQAQEWNITSSQRAQPRVTRCWCAFWWFCSNGQWMTRVLHWPSFWRMEAMLMGWVGLGFLARKDEDEIGGPIGWSGGKR
jgi:hypothetical protein